MVFYYIIFKWSYVDEITIDKVINSKTQKCIKLVEVFQKTI